jgi:hypothetical protein
VSATGVRRWWRPTAAGFVLAAALACNKTEGPAPEASPEGAGGAPAADAGAGSIQSMIDAGRLDEATARLNGRSQDAETLYLTGRVWSKKAVTAPLPTPPPAPSPLPRGGRLPPAPEFKPEEMQALSYYEKAVAARPDYAAAHVAIAELLAPHALRRMVVDQPAPEPAGKRRGRKPPPPPAALPDTGGIDVSVDRVISAYQFALQADPASATLPEALIGFSLQAGRVDAAEAAHKELLKRQREKPEPFIRYGDFLLNHKQDQQGAIEQYRQALIWRSDDDATRGKIADIFLTRGIDRFNHQQFASAEQEFTQAGKWITDRTSPQAQRLADYQSKLREIRVR